MLRAATLIRNPRKTHACGDCGILLLGEHLRAFYVDLSDGIGPCTARFCTDCALRQDEPQFHALLKTLPRKRRKPGEKRTPGQRFADYVRAVQMDHDGLPWWDIAEALVVELGDLYVDGLDFFRCRKTILEQVRKMAHATGWPKDYRNHYVTDEEDPQWEDLIAWGLAAKGCRTWVQGVIYRLTEAGKEALRELGPEVPR